MIRDVGGDPDHRADHEHAGRFRIIDGGGSEIFQRSGPGRLGRVGGREHERRRRRGVPAAREQIRGELPAPAHAHQHDQGRGARAQAVEDRRVRRRRVAADHDEAGGEPAVRHRDAGERGGGDRRADAGDDLERDPGLGERERLLAAPAEDERVATLEADDVLAALRGADHEGVDALLRDRVAAGALADEEAAGARREREQIGGDERVVEHEVGAAEPVERAAGEQIGIAGTGADERDETLAHERSSSRAAAVRAAMSASSRWARRSAIGVALRFQLAR